MMMDGPFWSIYPHEKNFYTLGSVKYSRLNKGLKSFERAKKLLMKLIKKKLNK